MHHGVFTFVNIPWYTMEHHGTDTMVNHGTYTLVYYGTCTRVYYGILYLYYGLLW